MAPNPCRLLPVRRAALVILAGLMLGTQLGGGCVSSDDSDTYRSPPRYDDRYDDRKTYRDEFDDNRISSNARLVKQGRGELSFRAGSNGRVWVFDERRREVVYHDDLLDGDVFTVHPDKDRIDINGRYKKVEFSGDHIHRIYFDGRRVYRDTYRRDEPRRNEPPRDTKPAVKRPVPDSAKLVAQAARGGEMSYKASANGRLYLYDNDNNVLVETFTIRKGQRLTVNVKAGLATLDGETVMKKGLSQKATYRLLFDE